MAPPEAAMRAEIRWRMGCVGSSRIRRLGVAGVSAIGPLLLGLLQAGCAAGPSAFQVVDYRAGQAQRYQESFPEGYYRWDADGNVDIVLRRSEPSQDNPRELVTQTIHLRTFWRPIPGRTITEATQLNALVTYAILVGEQGATFEGAGSVFFTKDQWGDSITGTLEYANLKPTRRLRDGGELFQQANLTGKFRAVNDARRAIRLANDIDETFGPLPSYQPK